MRKIILLFVLLQGCYSSKSCPEHIKQINRVTVDFCKEVSQQHELLCNGVGGSMMEDVKVLTLHFSIIGEFDIRAARRFCVNRVQELNNRINADESLRPYLNEYPFPSKGIEIDIDFKDNQRKSVAKEPYVSWILKVDDKLIYYRRNSVTGKRDIIHRETYKEALCIVQEEEQRSTQQ